MFKRVSPESPPASVAPPLGIEIARPRVLAALAPANAAPVRILCAPHGGGKSTALVQYARSRHDAALVSLPPQASRRQVTACLERVSGAPLAIVDQADLASAEGRAALFESIETNGAAGTSYLLGGASRTRMHAQLLLARGSATMIDAGVLPFDAAEIGELARAHGVAATDHDIEQLHYDTDGWPVAVAWIIRDAAHNGRTLCGAFEQWRETNGHLLLEFVTAAHDDPRSDEAFVAAIWSLADPASQRALERLDAAGYPIVRMRASLRPYRVLMRLTRDGPADAPPSDVTPVRDDRLLITLFGRFACTIAGRRVIFDRRRDQNILAYIALAPGATVTRAELLATFWPGAPRAVASQGLRTSLCRLRRAVSDAAGCGAERYVRIGTSVALDLERVAVDARWFREFVELAEVEGANGNRGAALDHYLQAERLYTGALLASEALEPALAPFAADYRALFARVRTRVSEVSALDTLAKTRRAARRAATSVAVRGGRRS